MSGFSFARVGAMVLRYFYVLRSSYPRLLEMVYWPTVQMLTWGFLQSYFASSVAPQGQAVKLGAALIGAVLLWDVLLRTQQGFSFAFVEEMWSRNLANLLMSPLTPAEYILSLMAVSLVRLTVGVIPVTIMAIWFFGFNLWSLGLALGVFFAVLAFFAWSVGLLVSGLLMRYGLGVEALIWSLIFAVQPLGCVYYPVATLPAWLQPVAYALPATYVFEGLRALLLDRVWRGDLMTYGLALDAFYFAAAGYAFLRLLRGARRAGSLLQTGE
ncbi:MAG TPA: ABC transporter permease [Methylocystis sp.]|nr:ABC transporter permease [Methylocystis sp.]